MASSALMVENVFLDKQHYERLLAKIDEMQEKLSSIENENYSAKISTIPSSPQSEKSISDELDTDSDYDELWLSGENNYPEVEKIKHVPGRGLTKQVQFHNSKLPGENVNTAKTTRPDGKEVRQNGGKKIKKADIRAMLKQNKPGKIGGRSVDSLLRKKKLRKLPELSKIQEIASNWLKL